MTRPDSLMYFSPRPEPIMVRGKGSYLYDATGKAYLDFVQGWAVNSLGHSPDELIRALQQQAAQLLTPSPAYHNLPAVQLAAKLTSLSGLDRAFLCSSGAEANECATKLARKWGRLHKSGAFEVITTHNGFHGRTLAMTVASGKPGWDSMFPPNTPGFVKVPYNDVSAIEAAITAQTCAVMVEPIQGEAGVVVPDAGYLRDLRALTHDRQCLLVFDEVQTGVGRTGTLFRFQAEAAVPDIMTLGKGLGGGVPLAAVVATREASCFEPGEHGGTYSGNPLMASAGLAIVERVATPEFLARVQDAGRRLHDGLSSLRLKRPDLVKQVRGAGLLRAVGLSSAIGHELVALAFQRGVLLNAPRADSLRLMPALTVSDEEIDQLLATLSELLLAK